MHLESRRVISRINPTPNSTYNDIALDMSQRIASEHAGPEAILDYTVWPGIHSMEQMASYSDLVLIAGPTKRRFAVHRNILMRESPYFEEVLQDESIVPFDMSRRSETVVEIILEALYSGNLVAPVSLEEVTDAFTAAIKFHFSGGVVTPLVNHMCRCIHDPKKFCDPSKSLDTGNNGTPTKVYLDDIKHLSKCCSAIFTDQDVYNREYQRIILREIRKRGLVRDVFSQTEMCSLISGQCSDDKFALVSRILEFYYCDDEAIQRETAGRR